MRILVTGSSGKLGQVVVRQLLERGHEVVGVDRRAPEAAGADGPAAAPPASIPTHVLDLTHADALRPLLQNVEAVCHLGSMPSIRAGMEIEGFHNNVQGTWVVFQTAFEAGVRKWVYASSIQAYGVVGAHCSLPRYLPLDEKHPLLPQDAYSLSKAMGEEIVEAFCRREPALQAFSLRFTSIRRPMNEAQRQRREQRLRTLGPRHRVPGAFNLFTYVHTEDAARAVCLGCEATRPGHARLNIASPRSHGAWTPEALAAIYGGVTPPLRGGAGPSDALLDPCLAREVLRFSAELPCPP